MSSPKRKLGSTYPCACGCNQFFIMTHPTQKYAPECSTRAYRIKQQRYMYEKRKQEIRKVELSKPIKVKVYKCLCPMCGRIHKMKINWAGKSIPRKYCPGCERIIKNRDYEPCSVPGSKYREHGGI